METLLSRETQIKELHLSVRAMNICMVNDIDTIGDLLDKTEEEICKMRGLGNKGREELFALRNQMKPQDIGLVKEVEKVRIDGNEFAKVVGTVKYGTTDIKPLEWGNTLCIKTDEIVRLVYSGEGSDVKVYAATRESLADKEGDWFVLA